MIRGVVLICVLCGTALGASNEPDGPDIQHVHTSEGVIEGVVVGVDADGVSIRREGLEEADGLVRVVPWFEIRERDGDSWEVPDQFERIARSAAIGKARRDRGDLRGCSEMYSTIAKEYLGSRSVMAGEVFGGLLEESLTRGDFYDACVAMLALERVGELDGDGVDARYGVDVDVPMLGGDGAGSGHRLQMIADSLARDQGHAGALVRAFGVLNGEKSDRAVAEVISDLE